jgi:hypothetical protein
MKRFRIGRAETNEIVLNDPSVSREHAELVKIDRGTFLLRDLGSTYGTSARHGSDWHLVTAENVGYATPIRIGEHETTVAELLHELDPLAVYMTAAPAPPWTAGEPRLSPEERAQQPATIHVGWGPGNAPPLLFAKQTAARKRRARRPVVVISLIGLGAMLIAAFLTAAAALS